MNRMRDGSAYWVEEIQFEFITIVIVFKAQRVQCFNNKEYDSREIITT